MYFLASHEVMTQRGYPPGRWNKKENKVYGADGKPWEVIKLHAARARTVARLELPNKTLLVVRHPYDVDVHVNPLPDGVDLLNIPDVTGVWFRMKPTNAPESKPTPEQELNKKKGYKLDGRWIPQWDDPVVARYRDTRGRGKFKITQRGVKLWKCTWCMHWAGNKSHWCSICKGVSYCSQHCQRQHWKESHRNECWPALQTPTSSSGSEADGTSEPGYIECQVCIDCVRCSHATPNCHA